MIIYPGHFYAKISHSINFVMTSYIFDQKKNNVILNIVLLNLNRYNTGGAL